MGRWAGSWFLFYEWSWAVEVGWAAWMQDLRTIPAWFHPVFHETVMDSTWSKNRSVCINWTATRIHGRHMGKTIFNNIAPTRFRVHAWTVSSTAHRSKSLQSHPTLLCPNPPFQSLDKALAIRLDGALIFGRRCWVMVPMGWRKPRCCCVQIDGEMGGTQTIKQCIVDWHANPPPQFVRYCMSIRNGSRGLSKGIVIEYDSLKIIRVRCRDSYTIISTTNGTPLHDIFSLWTPPGFVYTTGSEDLSALFLFFLQFVMNMIF